MKVHRFRAVPPPRTSARLFLKLPGDARAKARHWPVIIASGTEQSSVLRCKIAVSLAGELKQNRSCLRQM